MTGQHAVPTNFADLADVEHAYIRLMMNTGPDGLCRVHDLFLDELVHESKQPSVEQVVIRALFYRVNRYLQK